MEIDRNAPATAEGEIEIAASPETVWDVIADLPSWPTWNRNVRSISLDGPFEPGSTFRWRSGSTSLVSTLQVIDPPREIAWTGVTMRIHAVHVFRFEASDAGTIARSAESFRGVIPTVFRKYSRNLLKRGIDDILRSLKIEAERRSGVLSG